jgi:predicted transcriptional regulator
MSKTSIVSRIERMVRTYRTGFTATQIANRANTSLRHAQRTLKNLSERGLIANTGETTKTGSLVFVVRSWA